ncbi:MAG: DUF4301 family protein [Bacteroidales bacterium]|jgi:hypothetical protein|nr:DUF4301 family protein [Bacteroidales bacterium]
MLSKEDVIYLSSFGVSEKQVDEQIEILKKNDSFVEIIRPATIGDGIVQLNEFYNSLAKDTELPDKEKTTLKVQKFVPASGAATRMFNRLIKYVNNPTEENFTEGDFYSVKNTIDNIEKFAFADKIDTNSLPLKIAEQILFSCLNYIDCPKGLIDFHKYNDKPVTPFEEHISQGNKLLVNCPIPVHFTISEQYQTRFSQVLFNIKNKYNSDITFSYQKNNTNTVAIDENGDLVRDTEGNILLRPGGHGSLIQNLNELNSDLVFISNIDNVRIKNTEDTTILYRKILCGILLYVHYNMKGFLSQLCTNDDIIKQKLELIKHISKEFSLNLNTDAEYIEIKELLGRPIRVCGMVKNTGEPGGGPFWVKDKNGNETLQIVEKSQINLKDSLQKAIFEKSTHFNPVDIICKITDFEGNKLDLNKFVDKNTAFISEKTYNGKNIRVLEHPGLWNGAMADWITIFVEIPIECFNPVKELNDLLKIEHQQN